MDKLRRAFDAGRNAVQGAAELECCVLRDPAGEEHEQAQLRSMGKWRFIITRGIIGFTAPMFLWSALTDLSKDVRATHEFYRNMLSYLLHGLGGFFIGFCISAFVGFVVGLLAWRRLHSEVWPGAKPDPESSITTLGPLV